MPSEQRDAAASQFVAALGATMAAANYPVTMVRAVMEQTSRAYGLDHHFLALPNYVQVGSPTGEGMYIANPAFGVRYDQSFPLTRLVARAPTGTISPEERVAELDRIRNQRRRFPLWVTVVGYGVQSTGLALILQIAQLAFGILIAAQVAGIADTNLVSAEINRLGPLAPLLGVLVYGAGAMLYFGPPTSFLPWMLLMLVTAYAGQWVGNAVLGSYASGFGGGLTLIICALAISHRPNTHRVASAAGVLAAGARLARLHGSHPAARHPQHRRLHRHTDLHDVDRCRRADRPAAVAGRDPADVLTEPAAHA